jgi:hypothetical protein
VGPPFHIISSLSLRLIFLLIVVTLPQKSFDELEEAAASHPPERAVDPSVWWGIDIFE